MGYTKVKFGNWVLTDSSSVSYEDLENPHLAILDPLGFGVSELRIFTLASIFLSYIHHYTLITLRDP